MGVVLCEVEAGVLKKALEAFHLELQQRAFVDIAAPVDAHMAAGTGLVGGLVVLQPVGANSGLGLAQDGVALHHGFQIGPAGNTVTLQKNRGLVPLRRAERFA